MQTSKTSRAETRRANAARKARLDIITAGLGAEVEALNAVLRARPVVYPVREGHMMSGYRIESARYGWDGLWVNCANYGGSYAFANDESWDFVLRLAGVPRDPRALGQF